MTRDCRRQASLLTYPLCGFNKTPEGASHAIPVQACFLSDKFNQKRIRRAFTCIKLAKETRKQDVEATPS